MPKKKQVPFVPPSQGEVAAHFEEKFREYWREEYGLPIRDEQAMKRIASSWAEDVILHYSKPEINWTYVRGGRLIVKMVNWRIAATQWFKRNIENGKLRTHGTQGNRNGNLQQQRSARIPQVTDIGRVVDRPPDY